MHTHDMRSSQYGGDDGGSVGNLQRCRWLGPRWMDERPIVRPASPSAQGFQAFPCRHRLHKGLSRTADQEGQSEAAKAFEVSENLEILPAGLSEAQSGVKD